MKRRDSSAMFFRRVLGSLLSVMSEFVCCRPCWSTHHQSHLCCAREKCVAIWRGLLLEVLSCQNKLFYSHKRKTTQSYEWDAWFLIYLYSKLYRIWLYLSTFGTATHVISERNNNNALSSEIVLFQICFSLDFQTIWSWIICHCGVMSKKLRKLTHRCAIRRIELLLNRFCILIILFFRNTLIWSQNIWLIGLHYV